MDMLMTTDFWIAVGQIILIDILLGGDNAVVIALACRKLPPKQRTQGILHFYTSAKELAAAEGPAAQMRELGCDRRLISVDEAVRIEPALRHIRPKLAGATYTAQDESGDANRFARELVEHCQADGVRFLMSHTVTALRAFGGQLDHVEATDYEGRFQFLRAGEAAAMAFILLFITLIFTAFQFRLFGREVL